MTTTQSPYVTSPSVLAQIAGLPDLSMIDIKALWKDLFGKDTPTHNRQFLDPRVPGQGIPGHGHGRRPV
jgi:hypothetical protein